MIRHKTSRTLAPAHRAMRGLRKVLVALDGSSESETILKHLEAVVPARCALLLIHVLPAPTLSSRDAVADILLIQEEAERYLEKVREKIRHLRSEWLVETGDPAERILAVAREEDVDALALTTHARGGLTSLLMGSVARKLVQRAGRPVFLVRPD